MGERDFARDILDGLRQSIAVFVAHSSLEDIEHHLEVHVNVRVRNTARRNRGDIHRELSRADILS